MASAAPAPAGLPRTAQSPAAAPQTRPAPRRGQPDWLPLIGWFVEDGGRHSRINVVPLGNTTNPGERFTTTLRFFRGGDAPVHIFTSEPFWGDRVFRFEGAELLAALGETSFEGLVEITTRSLENPPGPFPWLDSWLEFYADDGSLSGSVPGFVFKGGTTKRVMSGKWQHWPGVLANDAFQTSLLLLNFHPRPVGARLDLFATDGRPASSETISLPARLPTTLELETLVPEARTLLSKGRGFGSLRIWSEYKLPGFVMIQNRASGVTTSFDHTVPFAGPPVD